MDFLIRLLIAAALLSLVVWIFSTPSHAQTIAPSNNQSFSGHMELHEVPSWLKTLMKIKIVKGMRIEDIFRPPNSTTNISIRSSMSLTDDIRLKASLGGDRSYGELIYYTRDNQEWYARQEQVDSTIGWRYRW